MFVYLELRQKHQYFLPKTYLICTKYEQKHFRISALASKKRSNQKKIRALYATNWGILFWKITKYFCSFLVQMRTLKSPFEINWPLVTPEFSRWCRWNKLLSMRIFVKPFFIVYVFLKWTMELLKAS